jgi:hypothetical protein
MSRVKRDILLLAAAGDEFIDVTLQELPEPGSTLVAKFHTDQFRVSAPMSVISHPGGADAEPLGNFTDG